MDPHQTDADKTALEVFLSKKCMHFEPGTYIIQAPNRRGKVKSRWDDGSLTVEWEDDSITTERPIALDPELRRHR